VLTAGSVGQTSTQAGTTTTLYIQLYHSARHSFQRQGRDRF
jgi:hypothetical protein